MSTKSLFNVIFEGCPSENIPLERAIQNMSSLYEKSEDQISMLFNNRPTVIKRELTKTQAKKYLQTLQNAGLLCRIAAASHTKADKEQQMVPCCPKCGHQLDHDLENGMPSDECPACGIVISKFKRWQGIGSSSGVGDALPNTPSISDGNPADEQKTPEKETNRFEFRKDNFLLKLLTLSLFLPQRVELEAPLDKLPPATIGQRIWAIVATFSHIIFSYNLSQCIVGFAVGVFAFFSEVTLSTGSIRSLKDVSNLLAMVLTLVILPSMWRGHTFGQRAMGILLMPVNGEDTETLTGRTMLLRRMSFLTRSVCAMPLQKRPWNDALIPFAAAIGVHVIIYFAGSATLALNKIIDVQNHSNTSSYQTPVKKNVQAKKNENMLVEINAAIVAHHIEKSIDSRALTHECFLEMIKPFVSLGSYKRIASAIGDGKLKLSGTIYDYWIGIHQNEGWLVLDELGKIEPSETFPPE